MSKPSHQPLTATVDRFENGQAILRFDFSKNNQPELCVPKRYLPNRIEEGEVLHLDIYLEKDAAERQKNLAGKILEEILQGE